MRRVRHPRARGAGSGTSCWSEAADVGRGGNLIGNSADALASTANFLQAHGWHRGAKWDEGEPNFAAILEWSNAPVYTNTIAEFADQLAEP